MMRVMMLTVGLLSILVELCLPCQCICRPALNTWDGDDADDYDDDDDVGDGDDDDDGKCPLR